MLLFEIPDIRLFWSQVRISAALFCAETNIFFQDPRFLEQFQSGQIVKFNPYSKFPPCYKDITFWHPPGGVHENDFMELVRGIGGDLVESVKLVRCAPSGCIVFLHEFSQMDKYEHKTKGLSTCYRIMYRSMDRFVHMSKSPLS